MNKSKKEYFKKEGLRLIVQSSYQFKVWECGEKAVTGQLHSISLKEKSH